MEMIKYETTLEEAREIKELGFDFSFACEKFIALDSKGKPISIFFADDCNDYLPDDVVKQRHLEVSKTKIPIVPYPILESCLPDDLQGKRPLVEKNQDEAEKVWFGSCLLYRQCSIFKSDHGGRYHIEDICDHLLYMHFNNAYDAFIWSVKNYPQETKEQFHKIMELYK